MTDVRLYGSLPQREPEEAAERSTSHRIAQLVAEFMGTFVVVFTMGCCLLAPGNPVWNATAIGCVLMVMVYATGPISGGHLNPAVSLTLALVDALEWQRALMYSAVQLLGGICAGFCCGLLFFPLNVQVEAGPGFSTAYAMAAEAVYTCLLCFVVCNCEASKRNNPKEDKNQFYALAIGFAVVAAGYAIGSVSGACVNPAMAIGLDVAALSQSTGLGWKWAFAELVAAVVAAALYREVRPEDFQAETDLPSYKPPLGTKCLSEFLGTFIFVFTVGMNMVVRSPAPAWSAAAALMCMIYSLADVSGGHFNPAVTLAVVLAGRERCSRREGIAYLCTQLAAGALAGFAFSTFHAKSIRSKEGYGLQPGSGYGLEAAGSSEFFFTFVLAYVVLACATVTKARSFSWRTHHNAYFALAIGGCIAAGGFSAGAISGGHLNPALCLGLTTENFVHRGNRTGGGTAGAGIVFSFCELLGGILAASVFRRTHPMEYESKETTLPFN